MKDKKQTGQFIVLGVLLAVCVGVVTVMLLPKKQSGPPPAQAKAPDAAAPAAKAAETPGTATVPIGAGPSAPSGAAEQFVMASTGGGRDPFAPAMGTSLHLPQNPLTARSAHLPKNHPWTSAPGKPSQWNMATLPPGPTPVVPQIGQWTEPGAHLGTGGKPNQPGQPGDPAPNTGSETVKEPAAQPDPIPAFVLTGVITGHTNVAIVRLGESRYVVREGQMINGKYLVVSVTGHNVTLVRGGQDIVLELGG